MVCVGGSYIDGELAADRAHFFAQRGSEHHDLLLVRGHLEDSLHIAPHICITGSEISVLQFEALTLGRAA